MAPDHDLVLFSRLSGYQAGHLEMLVYDNRQFFEHYLHVLGILPASDYALIHDPARARAVSTPGSPGARVLAILAAEGPAMLGELLAHCNGERTERRAVEQAAHELYVSGAILVLRHEGRQRVYDLAKRVLPEAGQKVLPREERLRILARRTLDLLAPVTQATWRQALDGIGARSKLGLVAMKQEKRCLMEEMLSRGEALRVEVADPPEWYILPATWRQDLEHEGVSPTPRVSFLPSLDPIVWDRRRVLDLFGFDFRRRDQLHHRPISSTLYILYGDALVGQIDCQMSWSSQRLLVQSIHLDRQTLLGDSLFRAAFGNALSELARFHGARDIRASGPLPPRLLP